ncbi:unnamed protein product [Rhizoctonia solani]|uniref:Uncharacterized protein n=1 Tax=Rhizoctonia solani TaxID=456999 RepID=A0A8H2WNW2_9AGAM|nr:unnamed protein product [Rhizoctonia solani]
MIEELDVARLQFQAALESYTTLCSNVQDFGSLRNGLRTASLQQVDTEMTLLASCELKLREARRATGGARNHLLNLTLINLLPFGPAINLDDLSTIAALYRTGELVLSDCAVHTGPPSSTDGAEISQGELVAMFPSVRFIGAEEHHNLPDPTEEWDALDWGILTRGCLVPVELGAETADAWERSHMSLTLMLSVNHY